VREQWQRIEQILISCSRPFFTTKRPAMVVASACDFPSVHCAITGGRLTARKRDRWRRGLEMPPAGFDDGQPRQAGLSVGALEWPNFPPQSPLRIAIVDDEQDIANR